jgi:hypothetical protein
MKSKTLQGRFSAGNDFNLVRCNVPSVRLCCTVCGKDLATYEFAVSSHLRMHVRRKELERDQMREAVTRIMRNGG